MYVLVGNQNPIYKNQDEALIINHIGTFMSGSFKHQAHPHVIDGNEGKGFNCSAVVMLRL